MANTQNSLQQKEELKRKILKQWSSNYQDVKTIIIFLLLAIFFTVVGIILTIYTTEVKETSYKYSVDPQCTPNVSVCTFSFYLEETYESPVYFWFQLRYVYQNHHQYVISSDIDDMSATDEGDPDRCYPIFTNRDANKSISVLGTPLDPDAPALPCGIAANTLFNDTYAMRTSSGTIIFLNKTAIAYENRHATRIPVDQDLSKQWIRFNNESLLNWLHLAPLGSFRKLWARIDQDLPPGEYVITVNNNFNISYYDGDKSVVIGTVNYFGTKNYLLLVMYLVGAFLCWVTAIFFGFKVRKNRKKREKQE